MYSFVPERAMQYPKETQAPLALALYPMRVQSQMGDMAAER